LFVNRVLVMMSGWNAWFVRTRGRNAFLTGLGAVGYTLIVGMRVAPVSRQGVTDPKASV